VQLELVNVFVLVICAGVAAQWIGWRLKLPSIVLFLVMGVIIGPVLGWLNPSEDLGELLQPLIALSVAIILFEGGLQLKFSELKHSAAGIQRLVSIGVLVAWFLGSLAAWGIGGLSLPVAMVFGAIMVVTGPTVIIPMLRQARLNKRTASFLKWEGIVNDPTGALLAVLVFEFFLLGGGEGAIGTVLIALLKALVLALFLGIGSAWFLSRAYERLWMPEYLKAPVALGTVLAMFALSNAVQHESGLMTVTIMGVALGNLADSGLDELRRFKEDVTVLLVSTIFVILSANLDFATVAQLDWRAALLIAAMLFLVRPLSIFISTIGSDMNWREKMLVGWIAPRGIVAAAVAGFFAPKMLEAGFEGAELLVPLIFMVIFSTVVFHGFSIGFLAKRLGLGGAPNGMLIVGSSPWTTEFARVLNDAIEADVFLADTSWHRLRKARMAGVPVLAGEVLSETAQESLEFAEIGTVLAATSNDAYNALVCRNFASLVGPANVYQIAQTEQVEEANTNIAADLRGKTAFSQPQKFDELWQLHLQGWRFYKTRLSDEYDYSDFCADLPSEALLIAQLHDERVRLFSKKDDSDPEAGDLLLYYAPKREKERKDKDKDKPEDIA